MTFIEKRIRLIGPLAFFIFDFILFGTELALYWKGDFLVFRLLAGCLLHVALVWEPVRFFIIAIRKRWQGVRWSGKRILLTLLLLVPYAFVVGFTRIFLEDSVQLWNMRVLSPVTVAYSSGITLLFVVVEMFLYESSYFFEQWNLARLEAEELRRLNFEMQFDALRSQIQPHFLFNTLNTLVALIEETPGKAVRFTEEMSSVYRYVLVSNERPLVSLAEELGFIQAYYYLLNTRYGDSLSLEIVGMEDAERLRVPPLTLQLLLENAVKHNRATTENPLCVKLMLDAAASELKVVNNLQVKEAGPSTGKGLELLKKKFLLLNLPEPVIYQQEGHFIVGICLVSPTAHPAPHTT